MNDARGLDDDDRRLIEALLDGDDALDAALLARLEDDAMACEYLCDRAALHAGLRRSLGRRRLTEWTVNRATRAVARRRTMAWIATVAACLAIVAGARAVQSRPYATVARGAGTADLADGAALRGETHELRAGVLTLTTRRGAELVIEAPAAFRFESPQRLRMIHGRMTADVPPRAKGFTVVTPSGEAVDLGTRFGIDVAPAGSAEVHVFAGEVVARPDAARQPRSIRDGRAFSLSTAADLEIRTAAFIEGREARQLAAGVSAGQAERARAAVERLRADPELIAFVDFEGDDRPEPPAAAAGQYRFVQGRWPGSRAADFTDVGDHLPLDVGGDAEWPRLTLAAWVRLDRLGQPFQSLYHTDNWTKQNPGQVHWMIVDSGVMRLALPRIAIGPDAIERHGQPESRTPVLGTEGRWMHLAFVYDSQARTASFYVDGRPDGVTALAEAPPARLGPARVGNWNRSDRKLSGRIDELVFVGRALSADEIRGLYEAGMPYRPHGRSTQQ